ncbi:MAG TPA: chorismate-binding protein, partial [Candidatus Nanopelagicaceae bacterium]
NLDTPWQSSINQLDYENYVEEIRSSVAEGYVYQVNACRILTTPAPNISLASLFTKILDANPSPLASFLRLPGIEVASASPELFLRRAGSNITTSPIKGTQPLSVHDDFGTKDQSENIMIVDLMRNDLSRICSIGSVTVGELLRLEEHPGLRHLVSDVQGILIPGITWGEIFEALMPPGSVSGAPKSSALELIAQCETVPRGIYCGTLGWIEGDQSRLSVAIRTFWTQSNVLYYGTGAGITWGSDPHGEWRETELKANHLLGLAGGYDEDGWQYGYGIFETLLVEDGDPLLFTKHMERAEKSAQALGISIPPRDEILAAIKTATNYPAASLRLSFGETFSFAVNSYQRSNKPMHIQILDQVRQAGIGPHKQYPFHENLDMLRASQIAGFDEVLLVDQSGAVGEGATCTYVFYIQGEWVTPLLRSGGLPGVMRALAIENSLVRERHLQRDDLALAGSMMALSSLRIAIPVADLDNRPLIVGATSDLLYEQLLGLARSHSIG